LIIAAAIHEWERPYFNEKVLPYIDEKEINYIGEIDDNQKNSLLGNAEALLNPIQWEEPFGLSCIEAMACGTPVATLSRGSMPEIIIDGVTGIIGSNIKELIERFNEIKKIKRTACRAHVEERFDNETMVEKYLSVYRQISD